MYTTTAFMHAKYMTIDSAVVSISSVNWSKTSYIKNREAGVNFAGDTAELVAFVTEVGSLFCKKENVVILARLFVIRLLLKVALTKITATATIMRGYNNK